MDQLEQTVQLAQKGDRQAVESLLRHYRQPIFALAFTFLKDHQLAEEAAQEAFLRIFSRLPSLKKPARFKSWALTITANLCRDQLKRKRPQQLPLDCAPEPASEPTESGPSERIVAALDSLNPNLRQAVLLRDVEGFSYQEVAEIQQTAVGTVKSRIFEARRKLRKWMTACTVTI